MVSERYKVAVVGATGVVGTEMLRVLEARQFPVGEMVPVASAKSAGKTVLFRGEAHQVRAISPEVFDGVKYALFSAGGSTAMTWAPIAASRGAIVVDNSSAWRMDPEVPLCVPEVNPESLKSIPKGIIANPNCSTIQMLVALKPLHDRARIRRIVVSTYQAVSGAGSAAMHSLRAQNAAIAADKPVENGALSGQLAGNLLMGWKVDIQTLYQEEELKMIYETQKILGDASIRVSPTTVRVPVETGHSESVAVEFDTPLAADEARALLQKAAGVTVVDDFAQGVYAKPLDVVGKDPVLVSRIRQDLGHPNGLLMWVVGDNLRKGAALNAVQILELLIQAR